jgi:hypothetical protein
MIIQQSTGVTRRDAPIIERIMTEDILHSTLDWLSTEEFVTAARKAHQLFQISPSYFYTQQNCLTMTFKRIQAETRLERAQQKKHQQTINRYQEHVETYRHQEAYLVTACQRLGSLYFPFKDA